MCKILFYGFILRSPNIRLNCFIFFQYNLAICSFYMVENCTIESIGIHRFHIPKPQAPQIFKRYIVFFWNFSLRMRSMFPNPPNPPWITIFIESFLISFHAFSIVNGYLGSPFFCIHLWVNNDHFVLWLTAHSLL